MRHLLILLALLFAVSTAPPACADDVPGVTDDQILIGMTVDLTGPLAFIGQQGSAGLRLYLNHINEQGGVHGRRIDLRVEDDGYQPARTIAAFRKLLDRDGVFCFVGNLGSSQTMATFPFVKRARVPVLMPMNFNSAMSTPHKRYVFGHDPSYPIQSWLMVKHIVEVEKATSPRLAVLYQDDGYGRDGLQGLQEAAAHYGIPIVAEEGYKSGTVDFGSQVLNMRKAEPTHVIFWSVYREAAAVMKEARQIGWQPQFIGGGPAGDDKTLELAGEAASGYQALGIIDLSSDDEEMTLYRQLLAAESPGQEPNIYHAMCYSAGQTLVEALHRAGQDLSREKLVDALETLREWDGTLMAPITYSPGMHGGQSTAAFMMRADLERGQMVRSSDWVRYNSQDYLAQQDQD
ncbi:MAG: ABC transporter substrate-binding protein [Gemmatimonadetes bacterium]|jgi:branched-chain amino acid transport system substrate-binding protein|nr:ABC transporter substrate-binding protein [Gemmatimonadota bacterium]MBT7858760.1 ABC transporter substrate-binding protein [Gemmatimonadota bacterium]